MELSAFDLSVIICVMGGFFVGSPLSGAALLVSSFVLGGFMIAVECSVFYGVLFSLTYISALLVLFLFFIGLCPYWEEGLSGGIFQRLRHLGLSVGMIEGVFAVWFSKEGQSEGGSGIVSSLVFCSDSFGWFLALFSFYLFLLIVGCSKIASRDGGALREEG